MKNLRIHTPEGFRDIYGREIREKQKLTSGIGEVFADYGYQVIETPAVEYFDVFSSDVGTTASNELYKFFDRDGHTLVLRPDFTPSVARAVAMHFSSDDMPYRLCYQGNTYVNTQEYQLNLKEQTQMGVELIGDGSAEADAEILLLTCDCLKQAGLREFQVSIGENDFFKSLVQDSGLDDETVEDVRRQISNKNFFGVSELLMEEDVPVKIREAFIRLPRLFGGEEVLEEAEHLAPNEGAAAAVERLREIERAVRGTGNEKYLAYDLGLLSKFHYYTGVIFSAFTYGTGEPVAKGGRYDNLLGHFGTGAPAVGMGISIDTLLTAVMRRG